MNLLFKMTMNEKMTHYPMLEANQCTHVLKRNETSLACLGNIGVIIIEEMRFYKFRDALNN